jgi:hypothetical protein
VAYTEDSTKKFFSQKLTGVGYTGKSGLPGVSYTGKFGLPGVAYTGEYRSSVWPTQRTPQKNFSHKNSLA